MRAMLTFELLDILICPKCRGRVSPQGETGLLCSKCDLLYPMRDEIPVMIVSEAQASQR